MITHRCKTILSQSFKNPLLHDPKTAFTYSLLYSSQTQKNPQKANAISDYFVQEHQFSSEVATKAASALAHLKTPQKCDAVLSFLKGIGFSNIDLQNVVDSKTGPNVLRGKVDTLKPKIKTFQELGFSNDDIVCIVTASPWLLTRSADNRILPSLLVLKNVLGSVDLVVKLLKVDAWFITYDLEKTLVPNIEYLKSCGIHLEQLTCHIFNFPRLFLHNLENLKKFVQKADEMKFPRGSKLYLYAITCLSSMSEVTFERKLELFRSLGFTQDRIFQMFQKSPLAFKASQEKIKEMMQVINGSQIYDSSDIVRYPQVFSCSIEGRLKPRLQVLEILENKNLISRLPAFSVLYLLTDNIFIKKFVTPYLDELGDTCLLSRQLLKKPHSGKHLLGPSNSAISKSPLCNQGLSRSFCSHASSHFDEEGPAAIDYRSWLQPDEYQSLADSTLHNLQDKLEEYGDSVDIDGFDVDYANEVLTLKLGTSGTYVINKQTPNRQIWMSSPVSGPSRYDWDQTARAWIYRRTKANLHDVLQRELEELCGQPISLC